MKLGTVESEPGEVVSGHLAVADLPTGQSERVPVVVVDGEGAGATLWVTATIHGDEPTGTEVIHDFVDDLSGESLDGTVVCVPVMNPSGFRTTARTSYYHDDDPNRYFGVDRGDAETPPRVQQLICDRLYEEIRATADAVVSLHTSWVATYPYAIRPRVPYGDRRDEAAAAAIRDRLVELTEAFGLPVVNQFPPEEADRRSLDRTLTGAAVAEDGIPAFTPELGGRLVVERDVREAAVDGLHNVLHAVGMVADPTTPTAEFRPPIDGPVRRAVHPHTSTAGIVRYRVEEGEAVESGQVVADVVAPDGETRERVRTERSGYVLSRYEGTAVYENDPLLDVAVPDDEPLLRERRP